jgi:hypothetical protein
VCVKAENQPQKQIPKTNTQKLTRFKRKILKKKTQKSIPIKSQDPEDLRGKRTKTNLKRSRQKKKKKSKNQYQKYLKI